MNYFEILENCRLSAANIIGDETTINESTFGGDCMNWVGRVENCKDEWKLYAPEVIKIISRPITENSLTELIEAINRLVKLNDKDGKEELLEFCKKIKMHNYTDINYTSQIQFVFNKLQSILSGSISLKENEEVISDEIIEVAESEDIDEKKNL